MLSSKLEALLELQKIYKEKNWIEEIETVRKAILRIKTDIDYINMMYI